MIDNILGNKTNIRILRLLNKTPNKFFTIKEIQENTGLGFGNVFYAIKMLSYHNLLIQENSKIKAYKLNSSNNINDKLITFFHYETKTFQNIDLETQKIISEIEQEIIKNLNDVTKIILFGSIAKGAYTEESDIDLAIIKDKRSTKDKIILAKIINKFERKMQPHIFEKEEFKTSKESLINNIKKEGILLSEIFNQ